MNKFQDLIVYQKALKFGCQVRSITKSFPHDELYVLSAQFKRAADSIILNIAEGAGNSSKREFSKFLDYSIRSCFECIGCTDIAMENKFIDNKSHASLAGSANELIAMLYGLQKSLFKKNEIKTP
jgi:four helix bundle protein